MARGRVEQQRPAVRRGRREARRERVELIMQALAQWGEREDQLAAMGDRRQHRLDTRGGRRTPGALPRQPHQRRAIAIVGLEPPHPQLRPCRVGL
jgi:hypothetical protein